MSHEAVIVAGARTPIGTARKGSLVNVSAFELATETLTEAVRRSGIDPTLFDDVIMGESLYGGGAVGRYAAVAAGLPHIPGMAHNRHCASGLATLSTAAGSIMAGMDRAILAGGVQSSSTAPKVRWRDPRIDEWQEDWIALSHPPTPDAPTDDMTITVGWNTAVKAGLTREEMDAWAFRSHQRAVAGIDAGSFKQETFPIQARRPDGTLFSFEVDEHPRRNSTMDKLASLKPLHPEIEGFSITAGNSAGVNDAAGVLVVTSREFAEQHDLEPLAFIRAWASVGVAPADTGLAPGLVIPKLLDRAELTIDDIAMWEINEAFASVALAATRKLGLDEALVNPLGSGCSLGHPTAMTGARMALTMTHELRRQGGGKGVACMCAGGGMAGGIVLDVPAPA